MEHGQPIEPVSIGLRANFEFRRSVTHQRPGKPGGKTSLDGNFERTCFLFKRREATSIWDLTHRLVVVSVLHITLVQHFVPPSRLGRAIRMAHANRPRTTDAIARLWCRRCRTVE